MPILTPSEYQLQVLAAAVTPVVLVSATAILIGVTNSRYISISDRMRMLTVEYRDKAHDAHRREVIAREMVIFRLRVRLVSWAERALYAAVACFTAVALIISATFWRAIVLGVSLPLFTLGILLIMFAVVCQLLASALQSHFDDRDERSQMIQRIALRIACSISGGSASPMKVLINAPEESYRNSAGSAPLHFLSIESMNN
jgi:hypothetical protein